MTEAELSQVDLVIPVKSVGAAKSRLKLTLRHGDEERHQQLVHAIVIDTVTAALRARHVRHAVVVSPDPGILRATADVGAITLPDVLEGDLNGSLTNAASFLRQFDPRTNVGALLADLPALRPEDLDGAIAEAANRRAACADRHGTGTTLLLAGPGRGLDPHFGGRSARAHQARGATLLNGRWPTLRCDVDTAVDLMAASELGLGPGTAALRRSTGLSEAVRVSDQAPEESSVAHRDRPVGTHRHTRRRSA